MLNSSLSVDQVRLTFINTRQLHHHFQSPFHKNLYNETYFLWKKCWTEIYQQSGDGYTPKSDDFWRQDTIAVIHQDLKIIALHLYSFFDLQFAVDKEHHYFDFFSAEIMKTLNDQGLHKVMTMEYFTVNPLFRKVHTEVPYSDVLARCGIQYLKTTNASAILAPARKDNKVDRLAYSIGFEALKQNLTLRGFPCDLIIFYASKNMITPQPIIESTTKRLWETRTYTDEQTRQIVKEVA